MLTERFSRFLRPRRPLLVVGGAALFVALAAPTVSAFMMNPPGQTQLPTTHEDFVQPGTQPNTNPMEFIRIIPGQNCAFCHSDYSPTFAPFDSWISSMMAQSARDPVWHAALTVANQDVNNSGEFCIRCHAPAAWLDGRSTNGTIDEFTLEDFDGINCHFCHRAVNPELGAFSAIGYNAEGQDPDPDPEVLDPLAKAGLIPQGHGNARYIVDPRDVRRGPFGDVPMNYHGISEWAEEVWLIESPFHSKSEFCGVCHDVSNPVFVKNEKGQYLPGAFNTQHPTQQPHDMFPEQRTYTEWKNSEFATTGVVFPDDRFGGSLEGPIRSCQDCHMPDQVGGGCAFWEFKPFFERPNMPQHSFAGSNTWVIDAVVDQLGFDAESIGLTPDRVQDAKARTVQMLRDASDMELSCSAGQLKVRVINQTGHKLPTGYPEGRRMWINVKFYDSNDELVSENGAYDMDTAALSTLTTTVFEAKHGSDDTVEALTGVPQGPHFHLALANTKFKDNRIPPRGFTNEAFASEGCPPVYCNYEDGQYWSDSFYVVPAEAVQAVVTLYYQTSSREYMEFLRDTTKDTTGPTVYDLWVEHGKSAPVDMDTGAIKVKPGILGDFNNDGMVDGADLGTLLGGWGHPGMTDLNGDGTTDGADLGTLLGNWG